ncbi:hypothetical protein BJ165DRAFT_1527776 [Panaeolus papilionaceus]|nr:hypothetical protein BJ165DRAFT_1527776 [Panaeolus papilionaceus]
MDYVMLKERLPRVISLLACCSVGWLTYTRYIRKCDSFPRTLTKADRSPCTVVPAQPKLENLSLDVLLEIMAYLEWHELLKLRQVSSGLKVATHQRVLWHDLIRSSPSRYMLKKRIQVCSSQELEDAFLGMQQANRRWVNPGTPQRLEKMLGLGDVQTYNYKILPGGRWLIKLKATLELLYTDLNTPGPAVWRSLIPPSLDDYGRHVFPWTPLNEVFDIDSNAEHLVFNVAIINPMPGELRRTIAMKFNIWRCATDFDETGHECGLKAFITSTFREQNLGLKGEQVCLRGDYITYLDSKTKWPVVVDWKSANGHPSNPPSFYFRKQYFNLQAELASSPKDQATPLCDHDASRPMDVEISSVLNPTRFFYDQFELFVQDNVVSFIGYYTPRYVRTSFNPASPSPVMLNEQTIFDPVPPNLQCFFTETRAFLLSTNPDLDVITCRYNTDEDSQDRPLNTFSWGNILPWTSTSVKLVILDDVSGRFLILDGPEECYLADL